MKKVLMSLSGAALALTLLVLPSAASANENKKSIDGSAVEVAITHNGDVLVRGAKVTAVSGNTISATTLWGATTLSWSVVTDTGTMFSNRSGNTTIADIAVGDTVSFAGKWNAGTSLSVHARAVKDWTRGIETTPISGSVSSINLSALSLVLSQKSGTTATVQTNASTAITVNGSTGVLSAVAVGDSVKATGVWNADHSVFTATKLTVSKKVSTDDRRFDSMMKRWFGGKAFFGFGAGR